MDWDEMPREELVRRLKLYEGSTTISPSGSLTPRLLALIYETMTDGVAGFDLQGRIIFANPAMAMIVGRKIEWLLGKSATEAWGEDGRMVTARTQSTTLELEITRADGSLRLVNKKIFSMTSAPPCLVAIYRDITRRKRQELQMRKKMEFFRAVMENGGPSLIVENRDGMCTYVSPSLADLLNMPVELFEKHALLDALAPVCHDKYEALRNQALDASEDQTVLGDLVFKAAGNRQERLRMSVRNLIHHPAVEGLVYFLNAVVERVD